MKIDNNSEKPIFIQFAEVIEDSILKGIYEEETQIPSTTEVAVLLKINPATANKGVRTLVEEGIVYKRRGIGMFVAQGARDKIRAKRKREFVDKYVKNMIEEAKKLDISSSEIIKMIEKEKDYD